MTGFDAKMRETFINGLCQKYPFTECATIGKSLCGREIRCFKIGSSNNPVLFAAAFHGMEWLTSLLVLIFAEQMSEAYHNNGDINSVKIKETLNQRGLMIVPCVNPDGVEISINGAQTAGPYETLINEIMNNKPATSWQANARGVDINHNFNANWYALHSLEEKNGITGPAPTRYGGPFPESEPETKALVNLCKKINFRHVIAFHSQGEEIYWEYGKNTPETSKTMGQQMAALSGYTLSEPEGLAVGGGFKDWFIEKFAKPGFTVEIGKGKNPLPLSDINKIYPKLKNMLVYCATI